ncbi:hypothetical protein RDJLphi1_gp57 [Roseobacter phage RDJL Phi 1]|uniref:Uncharacterized protein n=1 Tax=Roseobacter phage RDJL Phi 1 TaxID=562742 RepID=F4YXR8_9CAUD|nr:hypothetical protein RDJLphi1_gp57 [Roseobacter phage RDJL Phi 1]ADK73458.1 hypothetical protein RDJLphi1_gp57 [Roseobacter phage RDJL Phi 1]
MTNVKPLWQVALLTYPIMTGLVLLGLNALVLVACFISLSWEPFFKFDWYDFRVCMVIALLLTGFYLRDDGKAGGKKEWHQATADKWASE